MKIIRPVGITQEGSMTRASTATYFDKNGVMQTAANNVLRVSYDPANLSAPPSVLVEKAATNLLVKSEQLNSSAVGEWSRTNMGAPIGDSIAAPDGTMTGDKMVENGNGPAEHYIIQARTGSNETMTFSTFVKSAECTAVYLSMLNNSIGGLSGGELGAIFDLATGTVFKVDPENDDYQNAVAKIKPMGNSWFRVSLTVTKRNVNQVNNVKIGLCRTNSPSDITNNYSGNNTNGIYIWGAQLETGSAATSYIKTTTAAVTRAADAVGTPGILYSNIVENDGVAWSATELYVSGDKIMDAANHKVYQATTGQRATATVSIATPAVITMVDSNGDSYIPPINTPIRFTTTGALPTGVVAGTTYYMKAASGTTGFTISATEGGNAVNTSGSQSGVHTASASSNINKPLTNKNFWLLAGATNRWSMFDQSITSQSTSPGSIIVAIYPGQGKRLDSIVGLNCSANKASVSGVDVTTGEVFYSANINLVSNSGIQNLFNYFYEPIVELPEFVVDDVPSGAASNAVFLVILTSTGTAKVGGLVFGLSKELGLTEWGAKVGTVDYSVKSKDSFGNYTITPRAFSKKGDFTVQVPTPTVDYVQNLLSQYRSSPVVYIGSNSGNRMQFNAALIYGFYKDFNIDIGYHAFSVCSLSVEGLT